MQRRVGESEPVVGFLTVVEDAAAGLMGGYLLLNRHGRPLEFHCTAPVRPSRAQRILYGVTLEPFLFGEQIGRTLVSKGSQPPLAVCTDQAAVLALRDHVELPVTLLAAHLPGGEQSIYRVDPAHGTTDGLLRFHVGNQSAAVRADHADDRQLIEQRLAPLAGAWDLAEPFARIREAIDEAQRSAR
jgi:hypothetical protein